jgi:hypothetical protein
LIGGDARQERGQHQPRQPSGSERPWRGIRFTKAGREQPDENAGRRGKLQPIIGRGADFADRRERSQARKQRTDGRLKKRPPLQSLKRNSIDAGAALCFGDGRSVGILAGRKDATRKLYRDAYDAFRRFLADSGVNSAVDGWSRLPPNALAAFHRWGLDHRRGGLSERTASSYAYAISALLRQLMVEERLPASVSLEKLRLGLREALARGDYLRRKVDPRIDTFIAWVAAQPIPPVDTARNPRTWRRSALAH